MATWLHNGGTWAASESICQSARLLVCSSSSSSALPARQDGGDGLRDGEQEQREHCVCV